MMYFLFQFGTRDSGNLSTFGGVSASGHQRRRKLVYITYLKYVICKIDYIMLILYLQVKSLFP